MAYANQQFFGAITAESIIKENLVILTGDTISGSNIITNISPLSSYDTSLLRVSQSIFSISNSITPSAYITNINLGSNTITLSQNANLSQIGDTLGFSTPPGTYLFQSCSFTDPNNLLTVNDISGSNLNKDYAVLAAAERNGNLIVGRFHLYLIEEVVQRDISNSTISFFVKWGEPETEIASGDVIRLNEVNNVIVDLTDVSNLAPEFSRETPYLENLPIGSEFAAWNIALNNYLYQFQNFLTLNNNVDNYLITATGTNALNGESSLRYDGTGLIIGATGSAQALLQISGSSDLLLIKNGSNNGVKINNEGVFQFLSQSSIPTSIGGGIYYNGSDFFVGID